MDIFFTEYDKNIAGESRRDPLGLQPIWAYFGSKVIKNITTVSNDIRGFRETLLCLSIAGECVNSHGGMLKEYILLFEQLFIYAMIENKQAEGIIGNDNGTSRFKIENGNPTIGWKADQAPGTILASEISLGYYGRYKTPLMNMGIIDSQSCIKPLSIDIEALYGKDYLIVKDKFMSFLKKRNHKFEDFDKKGRNALRNCVCGPFRPCEKNFWLKSINSDNSQDHKYDLLMDLCLKINKDYDEWPGAEIFYKDLFRKSKSHDVENILKIEPFLLCVEFVFYNALNSRKLDNVKLPKEKYFNDSLSRAMTVKIGGSNALVDRFDELIKDCGLYQNLARGVLKYHKFVCEQKHSSAWVEVGRDGSIRPFVHDDNIEDYKLWRRDYYSYTYHGIIRGIDEISL